MKAILRSGYLALAIMLAKRLGLLGYTIGLSIVFVGNQAALASMVCNPRDSSSRILASPAPNDIHPDWQGESFIGGSWSLIPFGTVDDWTTGFYIRGNLYSPRGGLQNTVYVLAKEWLCKEDSAQFDWLQSGRGMQADQ